MTDYTQGIWITLRINWELWLKKCYAVVGANELGNLRMRMSLDIQKNLFLTSLSIFGESGTVNKIVVFKTGKVQIPLYAWLGFGTQPHNKAHCEFQDKAPIWVTNTNGFLLQMRNLMDRKNVM